MAIVKWGFRRFYSSRQAVSEISHLVAGSNVQQSERSSAPSVTSKKPIRGKVAIAARKKMLESFVDKYRAMNQGKFPSATSARKEVGGSFYSLKKMLQEMEYNVKVSSAEKEPVKDDKSITVTKELAIESSFESQEVLGDCGLESIWNSDTNFDLKEGLQPLTSNADSGNINVTSDDTLDIVTECHYRQGQFHEKLEQNLKDESLLGDNLVLKDSESMAEKRKFYEDCGLDSVSNLDTNFDLKDGLQPSSSNADTGNINVTSDDTLDIVTECHDRQGQFHEKLEQNLKDESLLGDNFSFKDSESTAEKRHGEVQNIKSDIPEQQKDEELKAEQKHEIDTPEQPKYEDSKAEKQHDETQNSVSDVPDLQKDEEFREKPSLWGNLKILATGLFNIWKK